MVKPSLTDQPKFAVLPPQAIAEFKAIFKRKYGIVLQNEEATQKALHVINFLKVLARKSFASIGSEAVK